MLSNESMIKALSILLVFGLLYSVALVFLPKPQAYFTFLYLKPGSYQNSVSQTMEASFVYGIENHEEKDFTYLVEIFLDEGVLGKKKLKEYGIFVEKSARKEIGEKIFLGERVKSDSRIEIVLHAPTETQTVHYWIKSLEKEPI